MRSKLVRGIGISLVGVLLLAGVAVLKIGPRFVFGILRYDSRHEGELQVGQPAPSLELLALDGQSTVRLAAGPHRRPQVLVFGSFT
jgi:hypothetical protein